MTDNPIPEMTPAQAVDSLIGMLTAIMKMPDDAQAKGGALTIKGVASLHRMQTSLQKNVPRMAQVVQRAHEAMQ